MEKIKVNKNGAEVEMELVLKFESSEDNKKYVVYTDKSIDESGKANLYAYYYETDENDLKPVLNEDLAIVEEALKQVKENYSVNE